MIGSKKVRERQFLDEVNKICAAFPKGEIVEGERPDFLIRQETRTVGIELVDYIRGQNQGESPERRNEMLWQKIADVAKQEFESKYSGPLMVHFIWNHRYLLRQSEVNKLAKEIAAPAESHIPLELYENIRMGPDELEGTLLADICHSITITRIKNGGRSLWSFISSGFISVHANELQDIIDSKNDKTPSYLARCDVVWLLVVADGRYISSNISRSDLAKSNIYTSPFEQVLVYDRVNKTVFALVLRNS